ncbi:hypothetical protein B0H17DRAFT_1130167 [Mycena rosella]|uniref:Uncharacterized protein n=1 Tax=Mycena rosella TaxID=1033263 RepID=A0AAD7DS58_MYCRO|nr:hypothetical protein B0H17DRAFT_1130167 [Mycena rosella]
MHMDPEIHTAGLGLVPQPPSNPRTAGNSSPSEQVQIDFLVVGLMLLVLINIIFLVDTSIRPVPSARCLWHKDTEVTYHRLIKGEPRGLAGARPAIELTLSRNKHLQSGGDGLWGFGQVLALLLLVMPLRDAWNALQDIRTAASACIGTMHGQADMHASAGERVLSRSGMLL